MAKFEMQQPWVTCQMSASRAEAAFPRVLTQHVPQDGKQAGKRTAPICYDFVKGLCTRGAECRYSHDLNSIIHSARGGAGATTDVCYDFTRCALLNSRGSSAWPGTLLQLRWKLRCPTIPYHTQPYPTS